MRTAIGAFMACALLAGCTDAQWARTLDSVGMGDEPAPAPVRQAAPPPQSAQTAAADDANFCEGVARQAAEGGAYDTATRQRVYESRLSQCRIMTSNTYSGAQQASTQPLSAPAETGTQ